jgi:hypothetical protein
MSEVLVRYGAFAWNAGLSQRENTSKRGDDTAKVARHRANWRGA